MATTIYDHNNITVRIFKTQIESNLYFKKSAISTQSGHLWLPTLHCAAPVLLGAMAHQRSPTLPTQPCYCECYRFERAILTLRHFCLAIFPAVFQ